MRRQLISIWRLILYPSLLHILSCILTLLCIILILFPDIWPPELAEEILPCAGTGVVIIPLISTAFMVLSVVVHMFRLSNTRAFTQLFKWAGIWGCALGCYMLLAIAANVQPAPDTDSPIAPLNTDTIHSPREQLNGPASLVIPIQPEVIDISTVATTPNLTALEAEHSDLLQSYLINSPRWTGQDGDDTFYTKPGHLVMVPPTPSGIPALVHVCFRTLIEGDPLPRGYELIKPGEAFPAEDENQPRIPDFALDLGRNHFLLLAWRGSTHRETALRAINAAIKATDERMQPLRESPTPETVQRLLRGKTSYPGNTPEFRLNEPLAQNGTYQAELYANPGEPGVILIYIKDHQSGDTLRLMSFQAQYSTNINELFRHDIPGSLPGWSRTAGDAEIANIFPHNTPLFAIKLGPQHQHFDAAFEIWFKPTDVHRHRRLLLRRCYKVQAYDPPLPKSPATEAKADAYRQIQ